MGRFARMFRRRGFFFSRAPGRGVVTELIWKKSPAWEFHVAVYMSSPCCCVAFGWKTGNYPDAYKTRGSHDPGSVDTSSENLLFYPCREALGSMESWALRLWLTFLFSNDVVCLMLAWTRHALSLGTNELDDGRRALGHNTRTFNLVPRYFVSGA